MSVLAGEERRLSLLENRMIHPILDVSNLNVVLAFLGRFPLRSKEVD